MATNDDPARVAQGDQDEPVLVVTTAAGRARTRWTTIGLAAAAVLMVAAAIATQVLRRAAGMATEQPAVLARAPGRHHHRRRRNLGRRRRSRVGLQAARPPPYRLAPA